MNAANITALVTGIVGVIGAVTALVAQINHILHHDTPPADKTAGGDSSGPPTQR